MTGLSDGAGIVVVAGPVRGDKLTPGLGVAAIAGAGIQVIADQGDAGLTARRGRTAFHTGADVVIIADEGRSAHALALVADVVESARIVVVAA